MFTPNIFGRLRDSLRTTVAQIIANISATAAAFHIPAAAALGLVNGAMAMPNDLGWTPAIGITRLGVGQFGITGTFAALKPAGVVFTANVDSVNGNDSTGDGSAGSPYKTIQKPWGSSPSGYDTVDIVVVASSLPANRAIWGDAAIGIAYGTKNIILRASDGGRLVLVAHGSSVAGTDVVAKGYNAVPVWTLVSGTSGTNAIYSTPISTLASPFAMPIDFSAAARATQPNGEALGPTLCANLAAITAPNSAFADVTNGLMYYRPFNDRAMIGDQYVTKGSMSTNYGLTASLGSNTIADKTVYLSAVTVIGGSMGVGGNNNAAGNVTFYNESRGYLVFADVCEFWGQAYNTWQANGGFDVYLDRTMAGYAGSDATNPHNYGANNAGDQARAPRVFGWDMKLRVFSGYSFDNTNNAVTLHEDCVGVYAMGQYGGQNGRVIGFVNNARGVLFGPAVWASSAAEASGYRSMFSCSNNSIMDVVEPTVNGETPGSTSATFRTETNARMRLHGFTAADITAAGLTIQSGSTLWAENATSTLNAVAGPLRISKVQAPVGAITRLRVLGVWNGAPVTAAIDSASNGTVAVGTDANGTYIDVSLLSAAAAAPVITLTHAPAGVTATNWTMTLIATPAVAAAAVTPFVTDSFDTLADNATLAGRTADTGGAWGASVGGTIRGLGGAVYGPANGLIAHAVVPPSADYEASAKFTFVTAASAALTVRRTGSSNYLFGGYDLATGKWHISKNVAGVITQLAGIAYTPAANASNVVKFKARGTTLVLTVDGTVIASVVDTAFSLVGQAGIFFADASTTTAGVRVDNFAVSAVS